MIQYFTSKALSASKASRELEESQTETEKEVLEEEDDDVEEDYNSEDEYDSTLADIQQHSSSKQELDLEDLGSMAATLTKARAEAASDLDALAPDAIAKLSIGDGLVAVKTKKKMVTPPLRAALEKQGYKIVGSHSGVKICRWVLNCMFVRKLPNSHNLSFFQMDEIHVAW
jgi:tRNA wybutosine-synthesizing protein 1